MEPPKEEKQEKELVHDFEMKTSFFTGKLIAILVVVFIFGIGTGYYLGQNNGQVAGIKVPNAINSTPKGTTEGSTDTKTFGDTAEGTVREGGIDGEGAFHLERPGGASQNVYMTSSSVDLSKYVGKKIKVWGQTQKAQHAGWLMDVGRIEVL